MLQRLYLKNFILISETEIDFSKGFSVLIGETGAGKSLIVDALQILCGSRSNSSFIKKGEEKAIIEAVFDVSNLEVIETLKQLDFDVENEIIITKEITKEKTSTKLNHRSITNSLLKEITSSLMDIHAQHSLHSFLDDKTHLSLLDELYQIDLKKYKNEYSIYRQLLNEKNEIESNQDYDIDFLKFQLNEIQNINPKLDEDSELLKIQKEYITSQKQRQQIEKSLENINIEGLKDLSIIFNNDKLSELYYLIDDELNSISEKMNQYEDYDIDEVQERLFKIQGLKKKYGGSIESILEKEKELQLKIENIEEKDLKLALLDKKINEQSLICLEIAEKISEMRKKSALDLENRIIFELKDLNLNFVQFKVVFITTVLDKDGVDAIEFLISLNKGEELRKISDVASGGELSRILLALKAIFSQNQSINTIIFDEVDSGVSGRVALSIGRKMRKIAKNKQVICITHLAAVAACGENHYSVLKSFDENRTNSYVQKLNEKQLIKELALISSSNDSDISLENAKSLLDLARKEVEYE